MFKIKILTVHYTQQFGNIIYSLAMVVASIWFVLYLAELRAALRVLSAVSLLCLLLGVITVVQAPGLISGLDKISGHRAKAAAASRNSDQSLEALPLSAGGRKFCPDQ